MVILTGRERTPAEHFRFLLSEILEHLALPASRAFCLRDPDSVELARNLNPKKGANAISCVITQVGQSEAKNGLTRTFQADPGNRNRLWLMRLRIQDENAKIFRTHRLL